MTAPVTTATAACFNLMRLGYDHDEAEELVTLVEAQADESVFADAEWEDEAFWDAHDSWSAALEGTGTAAHRATFAEHLIP